jgi:predicted lipoprotein with Yx(FWY)xxD motif
MKPTLARSTILLSLFAVVAALIPAAAMSTSSAGAPVLKQRAAGFGAILARRDHQALYYWNVEKRDFKVLCTAACARAWPPLIVRTAAGVPRRIAGISGTFGTTRRPDGRLQVTRNRLPLYTYAHERPYQVLCDDVDGWFVVRV